jgi:hypothetical protein
VRWLRYEEAAPAYYVWVLENQGGDAHVHWVVHVPKSLREAFGRKLPKWLARVAGIIRCSKSAINIKPVPKLRSLARYLLKGMDSRYALGIASATIARSRVREAMRREQEPWTCRQNSIQTIRTQLNTGVGGVSCLELRVVAI